MKTYTKFTIAALLVFILAASMVNAATPGIINYQAKIMDPITGDPMDTTINVMVGIWNDSTVGWQWWGEAHDNVQIVNGQLNLYLGSVQAFPEAVFRDTVPEYITIKLGGDDWIIPRTRLAAVPHALNVTSVDGAEGGQITGDLDIVGFIQTDSGVKFSDGTVQITASSGDSDHCPWQDDGTVVRLKDQNIDDFVGIGVVGAENNLDLRGAGSDLGGVGGYSEVTARFLQNRNSSDHSAIAIDAVDTKDPILYFSENTHAVWGLRNDASKGNEFQLRYHDGGANNIKFSLDAYGRNKFYNNNDTATVKIYSYEYNSDFGTHQGGAIYLYRYNGTKSISIDAQEKDQSGGRIALYDEADKEIIVLDAERGTGNPGRIITPVLEITGGCDLAEPFEMSGDKEVSPGEVVVIDVMNAGKLKLSTQPYDSRVAGIVSGAGGVNPGITLSQENVFDSGQPVAISGRVYCYVDASYGSIKPGDMLTTSATPGHAMKATDRNRAYGAVIGKAMTSLEEGQGLVLVLVNLQ